MRKTVLVAAIALALTGVSRAADTPAAEFTRTKRLEARITLSIQNKPLKAVLDEISEQLESRKFGRLRFEISPLAMSLVPPAVSIEAKDQSIKDILAHVLAPAGLGTSVLSGEIDPKDGWVRIVKSDKPAEPLKPTGPPATEDEEKDAKLKFDTAKQAIADGKPGDAKFLLSFIVKKYPTTSVAAEAKKLLETLK